MRQFIRYKRVLVHFDILMYSSCEIIVPINLKNCKLRKINIYVYLHNFL